MKKVIDCSLENQKIFLSASFQGSGQKWPEEYSRKVNPSIVTDATIAVANAIFARSGEIVFGGHPVISPLLYEIGKSFSGPGLLHEKRFIHLFQSKFFLAQKTHATRSLEQASFASVTWTNAIAEDLQGSLTMMRKKMLSSFPNSAAIFLGGSEGVVAEYFLFQREEYSPKAKAYPFGGTGGASGDIWNTNHEKNDVQNLNAMHESEKFRKMLKESSRFRLLANLVVDDILETAV